MYSLTQWRPYFKFCKVGAVLGVQLWPRSRRAGALEGGVHPNLGVASSKMEGTAITILVPSRGVLSVTTT